MYPIPSCIIYIVFDMIRYDPTRSALEQQRDLRNLSLASKQWSLDAQTVLFRDVHLSDARRCEAFLRAVTGDGHRPKRLGEAVRRLRVAISPEVHPTVANEGHLIKLLASTPRLYELEIDCGVAALPDSTIHALKAINNTITALRFNNITGRETKTAYQLSKIWEESLKFLVIGSGKGSPYSWLAEPPTSPRDMFRGKLKEFKWRCFDAPSDDLIQHLLVNPFISGGSEKLKYLGFDTLPSNDIMKEVLRIHGGSLRSLESRDSMEEIAGTLVEYCSGGQLEELGIRVSPSSQGLLAGPIGEGLKHLQLAMGWSQSLPAVTQNILWLKERIEQGTSLRSLETLTLVESNLSTANRRQGFSLQAIVSANQIRDAFTSKGVNLVIKSLVRAEELEIKYPLVDPLNFPRKPSILDYRAMSAVSGLIPQLHAVAS